MELSEKSEVEIHCPVFPYKCFEREQFLDSGSHGQVNLYSFAPPYEQSSKRAIKFSNRYHARNAKRLKKELQPLLVLQHENIVKFYGRTEVEDFWGFVMEFMEGGNLHSVIHDKNIDYTIADILKWSIQSASALEYIHSFKVISEGNIRCKYYHRNIKPQNMLLNANRQTLKICNFGKTKDIEATSNNTANFGSVVYMAPELFAKKCFPEKNLNYDELCDIYSWAVTVWECLTRKKPFEDEFGSQARGMKVYEIKQDPNYRFGQVENASSKFNQVLQSCLNPDPKKRLSISTMKILFENMLENCLKTDTDNNNDEMFANRICLRETDNLFHENGMNYSGTDWERFDDNPAEFEESLNDLQYSYKNTESELWSITKDFDIYFCNDLRTEDWVNAYTSFFQLSLFQNQFSFRICASFEKQIFFFSTNKWCSFEEMSFFHTIENLIEKKAPLKHPIKGSLTCATFKNNGNFFMMVHSSVTHLRHIPEPPKEPKEEPKEEPQKPPTKPKEPEKPLILKLQLYDFVKDEWDSDYSLPESVDLERYSHLQLVSCRKSVMAFFLNESGDVNQVYLLNKGSRKWTQLKSPENHYKFATTSLVNHKGDVYVTDGTHLERFTPKTSSWEIIEVSPLGSLEKPTKLVSFKGELFALIDNSTGYDVYAFDESAEEKHKKWVDIERPISMQVGGADFFAI